MALTLQHINHHKVVAIPLPHLDSRPVKGGEICSKAYGTVFNVAKRESGKTSVTFHFIKHCISKKTHVIVFCSSLYNDDNWIQIRKYLAKQGNPADYYTTIYEDGVNQIQEWVDKLAEEAKARDEAEDEDKEDSVAKTDKICEYFQRHGCGEVRKKKEKKEKFKSPKYLIIFDDISSELKSPAIIKLLKESRHYLAKVIINSQYLNDLVPGSRQQIDLWLVFKGQPEEKLQIIHKDSDLKLPFEQFWAAYKLATKVTKKEKFPFFYADIRKNEYRRNFNKRISFKNEGEEEQ